MAQQNRRTEAAANRARQREIYGAPLAEFVHRICTVLWVTQSRVAVTLGASPAMLSQLVTAQRVKIGDPAVLHRLFTLAEACARGPVPADDVTELLDQIRTTDPPVRSSPPSPSRHTPPAAAAPWPATPTSTKTAPPAEDAFRDVPPRHLIAAAAAIATAFPEIAAVLVRAAHRPTLQHSRPMPRNRQRRRP